MNNNIIFIEIIFKKKKLKNSKEIKENFIIKKKD